MNRGRDGLLIGGGATLTLIILIVLQSFIGSGLLNTRNETSTATSTATMPPSMNPFVYQWVYYINARDVSDLANMYAQNANVTWKGTLGDAAGTYYGRSDIKVLFGSFIGLETTVIARIANYSVMAVNPYQANATFSLSMNGTDAATGDSLFFKVNVSQEWRYSAVAGEGGQQQWEIANESWDYTTYTPYPQIIA